MIVKVVLLLQVTVSCLGNDGYITILNLSPQSNADTVYQCYIPDAFIDYSLSYGRSFGVANGEQENEISWYVSGDGSRFGRYVTLAVGMGVYHCKIVNNGVTTVVQTTRIRDDALITPANDKNTVTINVGDDVTITFNTDLTSDLVWRKDDSTPFKIGTESSMTFDPVETSDAGVYEMHQDGNREDRRHAFINLIVRACPRHRWGPPDCTGDCEYCYNGGVCDEKTGFCICAPGFKGATCETECNGNRHGWNCENRCSSSGGLNSCRNYQFCLPDPYGCSCVTGYRGLKCDTECSHGTFGADCAQTCHCKQGYCDRYTGRCTDTQDSPCAYPWMGSNCQKCQPNLYGENCDIECRPNKPCDCHRNGRCIEGTCDSNWLEPDCEVGVLNTKFTPANNGQRTTASCSVYQTDTYDVQTMIVVTNNDVTEKITTVVETNRDGQNITRAFDVIADANSTYTCVISRKGYSVENDIITEIFRLPLYNGRLTILSILSSSITIEWTPWNSKTDDGDGPVVGYFLYHKLRTTNDWKKTLYENSLSGNVSVLMWDTEYTFGVSAVRPGEGEGPIGKESVTVKTLCGTPASVQQANHDVSDCNPQSALVRWTKIKSDAETLKCYDTSYVYKVYLRLNDDDGIGDVVYSGTNSNVTIDNFSSSAYSFFVTVSNKDNESDYVKSIDTADTSEDGNTCNCGSIIAGTLIAGVFIGVLCTVIVTHGKQRWRKNMSKSNDDSSNAQHVYTNYASNGSSSSKPSGKIVSKSEKNETNELHIYQDYANEDNNAEYSTCDYHPNQESVYALPEESAYVN